MDEYVGFWSNGVGSDIESYFERGFYGVWVPNGNGCGRGIENDAVSGAEKTYEDEEGRSSPVDGFREG